MNRSLGFGSNNYILTPSSDSFSLRLPLPLSWHITITCKSIIQKVRCITTAFSIQFPVLFQFAMLIFFNFHSRYLFTIGVKIYLALEVEYSYLQTYKILLYYIYIGNIRDSYPLCSISIINILAIHNFAHRYFHDLDWFLFLSLIRCFNSRCILFIQFPVKDISISKFLYWTFRISLRPIIFTLVFHRIVFILFSFICMRGLEPLKSAWKANSLPVNLHTFSSESTFQYSHYVSTFSKFHKILEYTNSKINI